jgi:hypothetical protein
MPSLRDAPAALSGMPTRPAGPRAEATRVALPLHTFRSIFLLPLPLLVLVLLPPSIPFRLPPSTHDLLNKNL